MSFLLLHLTTACLSSYATETVMQICHGHRNCTLSADSNTFGKPCRPESRMYLKVLYTCGMYPFSTRLFINMYAFLYFYYIDFCPWENETVTKKMNMTNHYQFGQFFEERNFGFSFPLLNPQIFAILCFTV